MERDTPIYSFAAFSNTGKTTFLEKLIPLLKGRGLRVAVIKDDAHHIQMDKEGKDTWRFARAGADVVAVTSTEKCAVIEQRSLTVEQMLRRIYDVDLVLTEGYKYGPFPKIGIYRSTSGNPMTGDPASFLAIVSDVPLETDTPVFPLDDPAPLAAFLAEDMKKRRGPHADDLE